MGHYGIKTKTDLEHLKDVQKRLIGEDSPHSNPQWRKEWLPIIKSDADWDGDYLLDLILYKLEKMLLHLERFSDEEEKSKEKTLSSLKRAIELGWQIHDRESDKIVSDFFDAHCSTTAVGKPGGLCSAHFAWDSDGSKKQYEDLIREADKKRQKAKNEFFLLIAKHYESWLD